MTIEKALEDQTAAVKENTATVAELIALLKAGASTTAVTASPKPQPSGAKTTAAASGPATAQAATADVQEKTANASAPAAASAATAQPASTAADTPDYTVVSKAITDGVKANRDHVLVTLAAFGAKKGPELKAAQYADFLAALAAEPEAALA